MTFILCVGKGHGRILNRILNACHVFLKDESPVSRTAYRGQEGTLGELGGGRHLRWEGMEAWTTAGLPQALHSSEFPACRLGCPSKHVSTHLDDRQTDR